MKLITTGTLKISPSPTPHFLGSPYVKCMVVCEVKGDTQVSSPYLTKFVSYGTMAVFLTGHTLARKYFILACQDVY